MIEPGWIAAACAVLMLLLTLGAQWVRFERKLSAADAEAVNALQEAADAAKQLKELTHDLVEFKLSTADNIDRAGHQYGETIAALRTKIHEFETWSRDEFVRKKSFEDMLTRYEKQIEGMLSRVELRLDRIDKKLENGGSR